MNHYKNYGTEDFVWDPSFRQWVLTPNREIDLIWNTWLNENPEKKGQVMQAKDIIRALRVMEPGISNEEINQVTKQIIARAHQPADHRFAQNQKVLKPFYSRPIFRFAACLLVVMGLGWLLGQRHLPKEQTITSIYQSVLPQKKDTLIFQTNDTTEPMLISLEDGSRVTLTPGGSLRYAPRFTHAKREVILTGEAFFDISKDPKRPFLVYANGLITKVLGTSFRIKAYHNSPEVSVEVRTGRVSVFAENDPRADKKTKNHELEGIILSPNQKIIYARDEFRMVKTLVEEPVIIVPKSQIPHFKFEDTPVSEVFSAVATAYGIEIVYDEELMSDCPLTATLENQSLHEKLSIICKAVEARYEILDGQIVVHGAGCKN